MGAMVSDWTDYATGIAWGTVVLWLVTIAGFASLYLAIYIEAIGLPVGAMIETFLLYLAFTVAHEAGHGNISHGVKEMETVEKMMGWSMFIPFLIIPFSTFAKIHDYHHAFTNDPDRDPDHWVKGDFWYSVTFRALTLPLNYIYLASTRFKNDPVIAQTHKSALLYYTLVLFISVGLIVSGYGLELLVIGIIPAFLTSYILGMLFDWIPHKPNRQQGRYQNTRSYLFPGLKYLTLGQNYHHIHHLFPRVSWYNYEQVVDLVRPELEDNNAPIEKLFSRRVLPGFGKSIHALEPGSVDGVHKLTLCVESIRQQTPDSVAITFANLNGKAMSFKAGQYLTITKRVGGDDITRCYSICESPNAGKLTIGVKRVEDGRLSTYLNGSLAEGDELTVAGPFGNFIYDSANSESTNQLTLIAGGSGITPILSIAKTALEANTEGQVHLIYANRSITEVMFLRQLDKLLLKYPDRFSVTHIYQEPHADWIGESGYLDEQKLLNIMANHGEIQEGQYYICGPAAMKDIVVSTLQTLSIDNERVFIEDFVLSSPKAEGPVHTVNIVLANGSSHKLDVAENQTVLQVATREGVKIPYACGVGQCGCCMMQVTEGVSELASEETPGLLPKEKASGLTLACQCRPKSALSLQG